MIARMIDTEIPMPNPAYRQRRQQEPPRAAIIGGGPLGIEAAHYAARLGHTVWLFEREAQTAPDVCAWGHIEMFSPWKQLRSSIGELLIRENIKAEKVSLSRFPPERVHPVGNNFAKLYLEPLVTLLGTSYLRETRVAALGRSFMFPDEHADEPEKRSARRFRILARSPLEERIYTADYVIDATGVSHTSHWLGAGGLPALGEMGSRGKIFYRIPDVLGKDRIHFLGKKTLLVGNGTSAAETAVALAELLEKEPEGSFLWVTDSRSEMPCKLTPGDPLLRRDTLLKKANLLVKSGNPRITYLPTTQVEAVQHSLGTGRFQITLQVNHETKRMTVDAVVANVGSRLDSQNFERSLHPQEPGLYQIGVKAAAGSEDFFLPEGRRQIQEIFRQITCRPDLDLYAEAEAELKVMDGE